MACHRTQSKVAPRRKLSYRGAPQLHCWRRPCLRLRASRIRCAIFSARRDSTPGRTHKSPVRSNLPVGLPVRGCGTVVMTSNLALALRQGAGRSDLLERRLRRYHPRFRETVRALSMRHSRIADLAASFPALLFALAVPRPGLDPAPALARVIDGLALADAAVAAEVPLWLRKLPAEALVQPFHGCPTASCFVGRSRTIFRARQS